MDSAQSNGSPVAHALHESGDSANVLNIASIKSALNQALSDPVSFVSSLINEAVRLNASDILFEPNKNEVIIRFRVDGVLYQVSTIPVGNYPQINARIKVMAKLDTTEHRKIQEGQFSVNTGEKAVNIRLEVVQTIHGDMMVMRVLRLSSVVMELSELGMSQENLDIYHSVIASRSGLILVCGPTGSGKTTTLYSSINYLNAEKKFNVMTIEDPVEYQLEGVNQMPVREADGFTFEVGLKSILRLSPDIILVGEIRDRKTAITAVESGLTGHMVLSTVHAPDVVGVIFRLLDLEIEPFLINSALRGIVSQRLVRKICEHCKTTYTPEPSELEFFQKSIGRPPNQLQIGQGCEACQFLGFSGRIGIYEVLKWDSFIRGLVRETHNEDEIRKNLIEQGFKSLLIDGLLKAEAGVTSISEVVRNSLRID